MAPTESPATSSRPKRNPTHRLPVSPRADFAPFESAEESSMSLKGRTAQASLRMPPFAAEVAPISDGQDVAAVQPMTKLSQLMELAAARTLRPVLRDGETSVALTLEFTHVA